MQTIGERLEEARKRRGVSIREAAEATKIRGDYLQKFESNQFDLNLADIYVRGFLRGYALFLKLPADKILNDFKSLGLTARPKAPNREIYGRMELSVSKSGEREEEDEQKPAEGERSRPAAAPARSFKRSGSGMPPAPLINPDLVIRGVIGIGALAVAALVIWGVLAMFDSGETPAATAGSSTTAGSSAATTMPAASESITFFATGPVTLQVYTRNANNARGNLLLNATLRSGDSRVVPWDSGMIITASARENVQFEARGNRYQTGTSGQGSFMLNPP